MVHFFLKVFNMSIAAGWLILAVLLLRLFLRKAPKSVHCILWALVGIRLLCPFSLESAFSLIPSAQTVRPEMLYSGNPQATSGIESVDRSINRAVFSSLTPSVGESVNPLQVVAFVAAALWLVGVLSFALYGVISGLRLWRRVREGVRLQAEALKQEGVRLQAEALKQEGVRLQAEALQREGVRLQAEALQREGVRLQAEALKQEGVWLQAEALKQEGVLRSQAEAGNQQEPRYKGDIWLCDGVDTPFIFGIFRPRIILPSSIGSEEAAYVLAHERMHIRRHDHWWKPLSFLLLSVYWFHPLVWAACLLFARDLELACDEAVIRNFNMQEKKDYSEALLICSTGGRRLPSGPLAFGETGVKERIQHVLHYRKPAFWILLLAVICCGIVSVCFLTSPKVPVEEEGKGIAQNQAPDGGGFTEEVLTEAAVSQTDATGGTAHSGGEKDMEKVRQALLEWARAFTDRDGNKIVALSSGELAEQLKQAELLTGEESYSFGVSSPWPWDGDQDAVIHSYDEKQAVIYYYAWTSDPHLTVWRQRLAYKWVEDSCVFTEAELSCYDAIAWGAEFEQAYPGGVINGTRMDYTGNGAGEVLNANALSSSQNAGIYQKLLEPESAATVLLNLLDNPNKVRMERLEEEAEEGGVLLGITFLEDGVSVKLRMAQPYGKSGIWVPQDA